MSLGATTKPSGTGMAAGATGESAAMAMTGNAVPHVAAQWQTFVVPWPAWS